jgi:hypothetical protein
MPFGFGYMAATNVGIYSQGYDPARAVVKMAGTVPYLAYQYRTNETNSAAPIPMISALRPFDGQMRDGTGNVYIAQDGVAKWVYGGSTK